MYQNISDEDLEQKFKKAWIRFIEYEYKQNQQLKKYHALDILTATASIATVFLLIIAIVGITKK